jgi:predicted neutral ceramidase superfamily lipid hydrolase
VMPSFLFEESAGLMALETVRRNQSILRTQVRTTLVQYTMIRCIAFATVRGFLTSAVSLWKAAGVSGAKSSLEILCEALLILLLKFYLLAKYRYCGGCVHSLSAVQTERCPALKAGQVRYLHCTEYVWRQLLLKLIISHSPYQRHDRPSKLG